MSLCPGRMWALNEILAFVAMSAQHLHWELEEGQRLPERDKTRLGVFGPRRHSSCAINTKAERRGGER